jgi:hypothetical protein
MPLLIFSFPFSSCMGWAKNSISIPIIKWRTEDGDLCDCKNSISIPIIKGWRVFLYLPIFYTSASVRVHKIFSPRQPTFPGDFSLWLRWLLFSLSAQSFRSGFIASARSFLLPLSSWPHVPVRCDSFFTERLVLLALSMSCSRCCQVGLGLRFLITAKAWSFSVCMCGLLQGEAGIILESPDQKTQVFLV